MIEPLTNSIAMTNTLGHFISWQSPEGITAIGTCFIALSSILTLYSIVLLKGQLKSDHERSRRERAIDMMTFYATSQDPTDREIVYGLQLLNALTKEQCHQLWAREAVQIEARNQNLLDLYRSACNKFSGKATKKLITEGAPLSLSSAEIHSLRSLASVTLNKLELIASAWYNKVADQEIIELEFVKVFCPKEGRFVLENFRDASGIYPSIRKMCERYGNLKSQTAEKRPTG